MAPNPAGQEASLSRRGAFLRAGIVLGVVLGLDQLTKHTVAAGIAPGEQRRFLPAINLVHVRNNGVAFGLFSSGGALVLAATLFALVLLLAYFMFRPGRPWLWLPTGMLIGGAVGNLIDRLTDGSVIDFIKLPGWPAFNLADIAITFGILALLWVLEGKRSQRRGKAGQRAVGAP
ncbi:MAG: signal peptidase II [Solirubrobacteraceae bacterium]